MGGGPPALVWLYSESCADGFTLVFVPFLSQRHFLLKSWLHCNILYMFPPQYLVHSSVFLAGLKLMQTPPECTLPSFLRLSPPYTFMSCRSAQVQSRFHVEKMRSLYFRIWLLSLYMIFSTSHFPTMTHFIACYILSVTFPIHSYYVTANVEAQLSVVH